MDTLIIRLCCIALGISAMALTAPAFAAHPLGQPNMVFCKAFVEKVRKLPTPVKYADLVKLTDGEGMPVSQTRRHWDGTGNTFLTVEIADGVITSGVATCADGEQLQF